MVGVCLKNDNYNAEEQCVLRQLIEIKGWNVEEAAEALGDCPPRLYRVLELEEPLGKTATLAAIALIHNLNPIER